MALLHWLPLNGDTKDYGLNPLPVTSKNIEYVDGKTVKAVQFNYDSSQKIYIKDAEKLSTFTWCAWVCATQDSNIIETNSFKYLLSFGQDRNQEGVNLFLRKNQYTISIRIISRNDDKSFYTSDFDTDYSILNKWTHIALSIDDLSLKFYINGKLYRSDDLVRQVVYNNNLCGFTIGKMSCEAYSDDHWFPYLGMISDIRIYDSALSDKQIYEIAKGLIGHWKLDNPNFDATFYDSSGYGYHSFLTESSDPPSYSSILSKHGDGSYQFSSHNYIPVGRCMPTDELTISLWAYKESWDGSGQETIISCTESGGWSLVKNANNCEFTIYVSGYGYGNPVKFDNLTPGWHLFTCTYDGLSTIGYIDGEFHQKIVNLNVKTPILYNPKNGIFLGAEAAGNMLTPAIISQPFNGNISDVRIYCTALSDSDVMDLYQTKFSIDDKSSFYAANIKESDNSNIKLKDNGTILTGQITEDYGFSVNTGNIKSNEFLEI